MACQLHRNTPIPRRVFHDTSTGSTPDGLYGFVAPASLGVELGEPRVCILVAESDPFTPPNPPQDKLHS